MKSKQHPPSWIFYFWFLPVWSYNIATIHIGQMDPDNIGIAVGMLLLPCLKSYIKTEISDIGTRICSLEQGVKPMV